MRELELNKEYTYADICGVLEWKIFSGGDTKKKQISSIESAYEFYHPENNKTHKLKKSYIFTKQLYDIELVDNRCGEKVFKPRNKDSDFPQEKSDYLIDYILHIGANHVDYYDYHWTDIYVSNSSIYNAFGFDVYGEMEKLSNANDTYNVKELLFSQIVFQAIKSKTITKICKRYGYSKNCIPKGIVHKEKQKSKTVRPACNQTEMLEHYLSLEKEYLVEFKCKSVGEVINKKKYFDFIQEIRADFEIDGIFGISKVNCIHLNDDEFSYVSNFKYDADLLSQYQSEFKEVISKSVKKSISNRVNETKKYSFNLNEKGKSILINYYEQMFGEKFYSDKEITKKESDKELDELFIFD